MRWQFLSPSINRVQGCCICFLDYHELGWPNTTEIFFHYSGGQNSKTKLSRGPCSLQALNKNPFLPLLASGDPRSCLPFLPLFLTRGASHVLFPVCLCPNIPLLSLDTIHWMTSSQDPWLIISAKTLFPSKVTFWGSRCKWTLVRGEERGTWDTTQPTTDVNSVPANRNAMCIISSLTMTNQEGKNSIKRYFQTFGLITSIHS